VELVGLGGGRLTGPTPLDYWLACISTCWKWLMELLWRSVTQ